MNFAGQLSGVSLYWGDILVILPTCENPEVPVPDVDLRWPLLCSLILLCVSRYKSRWQHSIGQKNAISYSLAITREREKISGPYNTVFEH